MARKTTGWIFQATKKEKYHRRRRDLRKENLKIETEFLLIST